LNIHDKLSLKREQNLFRDALKTDWHRSCFTFHSIRQTRGGKVEEKGRDPAVIFMNATVLINLISEAQKSGILKMKKRFKGIEIFLVIAISLFILALPTYLRCTKLSQTKFISSDLSFENPGQEEGLPNNEKELKVYGSSAFLIIFFLGTNLFEQSSHLFPQSLSLRQKAFVLRC
jgi:hypothetical protein